MMLLGLVFFIFLVFCFNIHVTVTLKKIIKVPLTVELNAHNNTYILLLYQTL